MNLDRYEYEIKRTYKEYSFYSEGPRGRILKVVRFILVQAYPEPYYYLVFGDWNEELSVIDDKIITNNGDMEKVLATVAAIIFYFTNISRKTRIFIEGSSDARTRLYRMGINKFWHEIKEIFYVEGGIGELLQPFQKNCDYDSFVIVRKEYVILKEETEIYMASSTKNDKDKKRVYNDRIIDGPELVNIETDPAVLRKGKAAREAYVKYNLAEWPFKKRDSL